MPKVPSSPRMRFKFKKQASDQNALRSFLGAYSRRVKLLRTVLPIAGFILLVLIIVWPFGKQFYEKQFEKESQVSKKLILENRLLNPQMVDTDEKDHPFSLAAKSSLQKEENQADLEKPRGKIKTDKDTEMEITADQGNYDQEAGMLTYKDNVTLTTSDGYVFKTSKAQLHLKTHIADGHDPITGNGPSGQIEADKGFKLDKNQKTLTFYGQTRLILTDKKKSTP
jgi:lipopolysaccharide export system protein LptC